MKEPNLNLLILELKGNNIGIIMDTENDEIYDAFGIKSSIRI